MQPIDPNHAPPTESAQTCGTCGVLGLARELHRASLPVAGSLPTTPNAVTYRCRDEAACLARLTHKHRNDALLTSDDPLYSVGNVLDRLRGDLTRIADDLSAVEDAVGRFRAVHYQGEPDDATIRRVARALAPEMTEPETDPCYRDDAVAAIRAARFDAEAPVPDDHKRCSGCHACEPDEMQVEPGTPSTPTGPRGGRWTAPAQDDGPFTRLLRAQEALARNTDEEEEALLRAVGGAIWPSYPSHEDPAYVDVIRRVIRLVRGDDPLPSPPPVCAEVRYDTRGDCDGQVLFVPLAKPMNGLVVGTEIPLCVSHWQQAYRAGEAGKATP